MGLFKAFFKGLLGSSPQKFFADIMNLYFNAIGRGYNHEESMQYVIQSRYPYSDYKQKWIQSRLRIFQNDSEKGELKELVFAIWILETGIKANPTDIASFLVMQIKANIEKDPVWAKLCDDIDEVYDLLVNKNEKKDNQLAQSSQKLNQDDYEEPYEDAYKESGYTENTYKNDPNKDQHNTKCPSCGYARIEKDDGFHSKEECPKCGVYYKKYVADVQYSNNNKTPNNVISGSLNKQAVAKVEVIERDNSFIAYNNGTVLDRETNLMWAAKDNGSNINWADAKDYCDNYRGGGYTDWRMPTSVELGELCHKCHINNGMFITNLINITNEYVWAEETKGFDCANFSFRIPMYNWDPSSETDVRALPVRSSE